MNTRMFQLLLCANRENYKQITCMCFKFLIPTTTRVMPDFFNLTHPPNSLRTISTGIEFSHPSLLPHGHILCMEGGRRRSQSVTTPRMERAELLSMLRIVDKPFFTFIPPLVREEWKGDGVTTGQPRVYAPPGR